MADHDAGTTRSRQHATSEDPEHPRQTRPSRIKTVQDRALVARLLTDPRHRPVHAPQVACVHPAPPVALPAHAVPRPRRADDDRR